MKEFTDITVLLDRSGSMHSIKSAMEEGFNSFIEKHKVNPSTKITLIQFDGINDQEVIYQSVPVTAAERLNLQPRDSTPLYDAMGKMIDNLGFRYAQLRETERPDQVLIVVITDGYENYSGKFTQKAILDRVKHQTEKYKWQFVYLGANQDAMSVGAALGFDIGKTINFVGDSAHTANTWTSTISNTAAYASSGGAMRSSGASASLLDYSLNQRVESVKTDTDTQEDIDKKINKGTT